MSSLKYLAPFRKGHFCLTDRHGFAARFFKVTADSDTLQERGVVLRQSDDAEEAQAENSAAPAKKEAKLTHG